MIIALLITICILITLVIVHLKQIQKNQVVMGQALTQGNATIYKEIRKINEKI